MRLRVTVLRHELPPVKILVKAPEQQPTPVSRLLEHVSRLVPLESDGWGLEDYGVYVGEYECLHYADVHSILSDDDQVCIRALQTSDIKTRVAAGRIQISNGGKHLLDGIPFGREALVHSERPTVHIPPQKKRRLLPSDSDNTYDSSDTFLVDAEADEDASQLKIASGPHYAYSEGNSSFSQVQTVGSTEDYIYPEKTYGEDASSSESRHTTVQAAGHMGPHKVTPVKRVTFGVDSTDLQEQANSRNKRQGPRSLDLLDDESDSDDEDFDTPSADSSDETDSEFESEAELTGEGKLPPLSSSRKRKAERDLEEEDEDEDEDDDEEEDDDSNEEDSDSEEQSDDSDSDSDNSNSTDSSSSSSSSDDSDTGSGVVSKTLVNGVGKSKIKAKSAKIKDPVQQPQQNAPGKGKIRTRTRNLRRSARKRLDHCKETGKLSPNATLADLRALEARVEEPGALTTDSLDELERARQAVLDMLHSAQEIDILSNGESDSQPAENAPPKSLETNGCSQDGELEEVPTLAPGKKKRKTRLDVASSQRMVLGSLGLKNPRSKAEEAKLRAGAVEHFAPKSKTPKPGAEDAAEAEGMERVEDNDTGDSWKTKINLTAVECVYNGVMLSAPPFPFRQRWDPQQQSARGGKKRPRLTEDDSGPASKRQAGEETVQLDYDDPVSTVKESPPRDASPDLTELPADLESYSTLSKDDCKPGAVIAFSQLEVSAATNWQPGWSPMRTAKIVEFDSSGEDMFVLLAKRDREVPKYDRRGKRITSNLDMRANLDVDEGMLHIDFDNLQKAYLLQEAASSHVVPDSVPFDLNDDEPSSPSDESPEEVQVETQPEHGEEAENGVSQLGPDEDEEDGVSQELQAAQRRTPLATASEDSSGRLVDASA